MPNAIHSPLAPTDRRAFLRTSALTAIAGGLLAACTKNGGTAAGASAAKPSADSDQSGGATAAHPAVSSATAAAEEMDRMHEASMKAFPAKTVGLGNQLLAPKIVDGVKVFELTASAISWETSPGVKVDAFAYNNQVPGPQIRVTEGDRVRVVLKNNLPESTTIHFHGLEIVNAMDGVSYMTQPPVKSGASFTYEFVVPNSGTHMYHSHHNSTKQVGMGLLGAFLVAPQEPSPVDSADVDHVMVLNDGFHGYTFNGKSFPATEPIVAKQGQKVRIRFMNEGMMIHPMHLHGNHMTVITKDGWPVPAPWRCDTLNVAPGERYDVIVNCTNPGTWALHCHILPHAESDHGMFGMVTALIVQKA